MEKTASTSGHEKGNRPLSHREFMAILREVGELAMTDSELAMAYICYLCDTEWHPEELMRLKAMLKGTELGLVDAKAELHLAELKNIMSNPESVERVIQRITDRWAKTGYANLGIEDTDIVPENRSLSMKIEFVRLLSDVVDELEDRLVNGPNKWDCLQPRAAELMRAIESRWPRGVLRNGPPDDETKPAAKTRKYVVNVGGEKYALSATQFLLLLISKEVERPQPAEEPKGPASPTTPAAPAANAGTDPAPKPTAKEG